MASSVRLEIITPSKKFYQGDVELVIVRTLEGDEGFMKGHAWACKLLDIGEMWIRRRALQRIPIRWLPSPAVLSTSRIRSSSILTR